MEVGFSRRSFIRITAAGSLGLVAGCGTIMHPERRRAERRAAGLGDCRARRAGTSAVLHSRRDRIRRRFHNRCDLSSAGRLRRQHPRGDRPAVRHHRSAARRSEPAAAGRSCVTTRWPRCAACLRRVQDGSPREAQRLLAYLGYPSQLDLLLDGKGLREAARRFHALLPYPSSFPTFIPNNSPNPKLFSWTKPPHAPLQYPRNSGRRSAHFRRRV